MVNFKQWALLLTVGILNIRAETEEQPKCIFTVDNGKLTGVSTCKCFIFRLNMLNFKFDAIIKTIFINY